MEIMLIILILLIVIIAVFNIKIVPQAYVFVVV